MEEPDQYIQPLLHTIETTVKQYAGENPALNDKDIEFVYTAYQGYFKRSRGGKDVPEPSSTIKVRERLLDALWEAILAREELGADDELINSDYSLAGRTVPNLETLYAACFKRLEKSARRWRGRDGAKGYIAMLNELVV